MPNKLHPKKTTAPDAIGELTHDIRNAIMPALAYMDIVLAQSNDLPANIRDSLDRIDESIRLVVALISEPGDSVYDRVVGSRPVDADATLIRAMRAGRRYTTEAIALRVLRPPSPMRVNANEVALYRSLQNLVVNAIQAIEPAAGVITARCRAVRAFEEIPRMTRERYGLSDRPHVHISIEDTGRGMTPEQVYLASRSSFTTKPDGRGIGLGIVRKFLERESGGLHIESTEGGGSTFSIYLPSATQAVSATPSQSGIHIIPQDPDDF